MLVFVVSGPALARTPDDPEYTTQKNLWEQIQAPEAWDYTTGSRDVIVATIDTGADSWHDDIKGNIWTNPYETPDNGVDDDKNGYVDDINGWNFVEDNNDVRTSVFGSDDDKEAVQHGTIIAGLIGAEGGNGLGGVGLNWNVTIMPLRAIESSGAGDYEVVIKAVDYAVKNGASVINISFVGEIDDGRLKEHLRAAYDKGVVVVSAAGNHPRGIVGDLTANPLYPACYDRGDDVNWIITVGAVNALDRLSGFSNIGNCIDIMAPGENIFSTERYAPQYGYDKKFGGPWKGTSFAAPLVSATVALLKSLHPEWGPAELIETVLNTADPIEVVNLDHRGELGRGRLNSGKAVAVAARLKPPNTSGGYYYFFKGNSIKRLNFNTGGVEAVTTITNGILKAVVPYNPNYGSKLQVVALVKRGDWYYLQLLKDSGEPIREISLALAETKLSTVRRLRVTPLPSAPGRFVVEIYFPKKKQTIFRAFNDSGEAVRDVKTAGALLAWTIGRKSPNPIAVQEDRKNLKVREFSWNGNPPSSFVIAKSPYGQVEAIRVGRVNITGKEQAVVITKRGKEVKQMIVDLETGILNTKVISKAGGNASWRLLLAESTANQSMLIFPFSVGGGDFKLSTADGEVAANISVPGLSGTTD